MGNVKAIILAAGEGKRMKSKLPKVIHTLCGKPMLNYVLESVEGAGIKEKIIVLGFQARKVKKVLAGKLKKNAKIVIQQRQLGTGHAVFQTRNLLKNYKGDLLILCGDTPLLQGDILKKIINKHQTSKNVATVLTTCLDNPSGYGRIIRRGPKIKEIIEEKEATRIQRRIKEVNSGVYCFKASTLFSILPEITSNNVQGEYYLTDVLKILVQRQKKVEAYLTDKWYQVKGINSQEELKEAEKIMLSSRRN